MLRWHVGTGWHLCQGSACVLGHPPLLQRLTFPPVPISARGHRPLPRSDVFCANCCRDEQILGKQALSHNRRKRKGPAQSPQAVSVQDGPSGAAAARERARAPRRGPLDSPRWNHVRVEKWPQGVLGRPSEEVCPIESSERGLWEKS